MCYGLNFFILIGLCPEFLQQAQNARLCIIYSDLMVVSDPLPAIRDPLELETNQNQISLMFSEKNKNVFIVLLQWPVKLLHHLEKMGHFTSRSSKLIWFSKGYRFTIVMPSTDGIPFLNNNSHFLRYESLAPVFPGVMVDIDIIKCPKTSEPPITTCAVTITLAVQQF